MCATEQGPLAVKLCRSHDTQENNRHRWQHGSRARRPLQRGLCSSPAQTSSVENNRVFNLGVGGDGVVEMLTRGPEECRARRPDLIVLYPGLNDTRRVGGPEVPPQHSFESVRKTLGTLISELGQISPLVVFSAVPVDESRTSPFWGKWYFRMSDAATMAEVVAEVCRVTDTPHMSLFETWASRADLKDLLADGVHLNSAGHELLFQELTSFLCGLFTANQ